MKLLHLCVAAAVAVGLTASPHIARAQALGEAATLGAGVSSVGSASGSALSNSLNRTMESEGHRISSSGKASTSSGVMNLHWSRKQLKRSATTRTQAKRDAKAGSRKGKPDFVIFGADPQNTDFGDASVNQPRALRPPASQPKVSKDTRDTASSGTKNSSSATH